MIADIIRHYDEELTSDLGAETAGRLVAGLREANLFFGDRPLCEVLRPQFLSAVEYGRIRQVCARLLSALGRAQQAIRGDPALLALVAPSTAELTVLGIGPAPLGPAPLSRLDAFLSRDTGALQFLEFNAETPAGVGYCDALADLFADLEPMRRLASRHRLRALRGGDAILGTLLASHQAAGLGEPPAVAIVDWEDVPTRPEHALLAEHFRSRGVVTELGTPDALRFRHGHLYLGDRLITVVYKRILVAELLAAGGLGRPLVDALRAGVAVMVNPFACKLMHKKAIFAVLTDERYEHLYSAAELATIRAHVPWTRRVEERWTCYQGKEIDLLPWAEAARTRLVLKANDAYGGQGVMLGWTVDGETWARRLAEGLSEPLVLQERVRVTVEPFPVWRDGSLSIEMRSVDLDPFCYQGRYVQGALTRLSPDGLVNVTAGATVAPTFVLDV